MMYKVLQLKSISLTLSLFAVCLSPMQVFATAATATEHPLFIHTEAGMAVGKDDQQTDFFYRAGLGFSVSRYLEQQFNLSADNGLELDLGLAVSHLAAAESGTFKPAFEPYVRGRFSISDANALYAEAGYRTAGEHLTMGLGLLHSVTPDWQLSAGYRWYKQPDNSVQGDVYAITLGLQYRFGAGRFSSATPSAVVASAAPGSVMAGARPADEWLANTAAVAPTAVEQAAILNAALSDTAAETNTPDNYVPDSHTPDSYTIVRGDWLLKIARRQGTTMQQLVKLNPWLKARKPRRWVIYPDEVLQLRAQTYTP